VSPGVRPRRPRLWIIGVGTVGRWLLETLVSRAEELESRYGLAPEVVGVATARDGFIHSDAGLDLPTLLRIVAAGRPLADLPNVRRWPSALEGMRASTADVLVEVSASAVEADGEPGAAHMREALSRRIAVVTSNKWPVALHGVELSELARRHDVPFRAESTVMSGTPTLSALVEGLAGARPSRLRGVLNATANFILTRVEVGDSYAEALAAAQEAGLAERDPSADVDGLDAAAKAMILSGLVLGTQLRADEVPRRGIAGIDREQVEAARRRGRRIKEVVTVERFGAGSGAVSARVEPVELAADDPLARVDGTANILTCAAEPVGEVSIIGPGAGPQLAGQGVLADLIAAARSSGLAMRRPAA
jgi:homoserine dehydrogenase